MIKNFLKRPIIWWSSIIMGVIIGIYGAKIIPVFAFFYDIYISLLKMTSTPIIICAITVNMRNIFRRFDKQIIALVFLLSFMMFIFTSFFCVCVCKGLKNKMMPDKDVMVELVKIGQQNKDIEDNFDKLFLYEKNDVTNGNGLSLETFLLDTIPNNIFESMVNDYIIEIILFFAIFGIMLNKINKGLSDSIINIFEGIGEVIYEFFDKMLLYLPFAIMVQTALLVQDQNVNILFLTLFKLICVVCLCFLIIILISYIIIYKNTKCNFKMQIRAIKRMAYLSFITGYRLTTFTAGLKDMQILNISKEIIGSVMPVNISIFPFGKIMRTIIIAMYVAYIYSVKIDLRFLFIMLIWVLIYSIFTTNLNKRVSISTLEIILTPLALPINVGVLIWEGIEEVSKWIEAFCDIYVNLAIISILDNRLKNGQKRDS